MPKITEVKLTPSEKLANVIGGGKITRPQAVKKLWNYIKKECLQDSKNKRQINADEKLRTLFGKSSVSMFDLGKIISNNLK